MSRTVLDKACTLRYQLPNQPPVDLLLEEFRVKALIVDVSARVTLTHVFNNPLDTPTGRAKYIITVPASAAVCAFEMRTADGRVVVGLVKEKTQATKDFEEAFKEGRFAGLVDWVSDDTFTISVGSIPAKQSVTTRLVYVLDLGVDESIDEIRFQIPMWLGQRYGTTPPGLLNASRPATHTRMRIKAEIQTSGRIREITSPTHLSEILMTPYITQHNENSQHRASVSLKLHTFLQSDFVLIIRADELDAPRCFAEIEKAPGRNGLDTIALQLNIVPKFSFPPPAAQEYIFLVDRSQSMDSEGRIDTAKRILGILLKVIPNNGSFFNIWSFGTNNSSLWPHSVPYNEQSLSDAILHINSMGADYGGTELESALRNTLHSRHSSVPTSIFVLTDGEVNDSSTSQLVVHEAVVSSTYNEPLRVFSLGIGSTASSATCEAIAQAGRGVCLMATTTESIIGKTAKLFRAGRSTSLENITIDWGVLESNDQRAPTVNFSRDHSSRYAMLPPISAKQQAPSIINNIFPGMRSSVFVIISQKNILKPKSVTIRGNFNHGGKAFEQEIPVTRIRLASAAEGLPLIHTLAARRLMTEYNEGRVPLPMAVGTATVEEVRKAIVIRLGEQFQLASLHTSFVAIDEGSADMQRQRIARLRRDGSRSDIHSNGMQSSAFSFIDYVQAGIQVASDIMLGSFRGPASRYERRRLFPGTMSGAPAARASVGGVAPSETQVSEAQEDIDDGASDMTFSTLSSLDSYSDWSEWTPPPSPRPELAVVEDPIPRSKSPPIQTLVNAPNTIRTLFHSRNASVPDLDVPVPHEVDNIIRLQNFDGSFDPHSDLSREIGVDIYHTAGNHDHRAWATALAMTFLKKRLRHQPDLYQTLLEKAEEYVKGKNEDLPFLMDQAAAYIQ